METILAIVVATAVIFFGALISIGNERQRRAIDGLRDQVVLWAVQDLKIKRKHLEQAIQVPDPLGWLNRTMSNLVGYDLQLQIVETFDQPQALVCLAGSEDAGSRLILSPLSPSDLRRLKNNKHNRLSQFADHNPLWVLPRDAKIHELSVLDGGYLFDLELMMVWEAITGRLLNWKDRIWLYIF